MTWLDSDQKKWRVSHSDCWSANTQLPVMVSIQSYLSMFLSLCQLLKPDYEKHLLCYCVLQSMTEMMWNYKLASRGYNQWKLFMLVLLFIFKLQLIKNKNFQHFDFGIKKVAVHTILIHKTRYVELLWVKVRDTIIVMGPVISYQMSAFSSVHISHAL